MTATHSEELNECGRPTQPLRKVRKVHMHEFSLSRAVAADEPTRSRLGELFTIGPIADEVPG